MALRVAWLIFTWTVLGTLPSLPFFTFYFFIFIILLIYIIYFIIFYSLLFFYLEWIQNVFWPRLTYKRVEPVVSISWASCFVILVTHPKSYIETTDRRDFGGKKPSKWRWRRVLWNCYREKFRNFLALAEPYKNNNIFSRFRVPLDCTAHSLQETVLPKPMVPMESRYSGIYRHLKSA